MSRQHRGTGNVYQPTYKDKQTGDVRTAAVWWVRWGYRGKILRQSSHSTNKRAVAVNPASAQSSVPASDSGSAAY